MKKMAPWLIIIAGILWGLMGIFVRKLGEYGFTSIQIASLRIIGAALIFLVIGMLRRNDSLKICVRDLLWFVGTGIGSLLLFTICYFTTIRISSLSVAAILLYTEPIMVMILSIILFGEKITIRKIIALICTFAGCILVTGVGGDIQIGIQAASIGLLSAFGYGMYSILGTYVLKKYKPYTVTMYTFLVAAFGAMAVCRPFDIIQKIRHTESPGWTIVLLFLTSFFTAVLPYLFYTIGLSYVKASSAAILASIEPVVAAVAGFLVFEEKIAAGALIGIVLVLGSIIIINFEWKH